MAGWFAKQHVDAVTTHLTEPYVNDYLRANIWHVVGRDADLLVDTGMGICPLSPEIATTAGKPLIVVATHIHLDHIGSMHEFQHRAGPAYSAAEFERMGDSATYADFFRDMGDPVSQLPEPDWTAGNYAIKPAPLTRALGEGDSVDLGDRRFTVLHLPGHSPDSIALIDETEGTFFSGDAVYDDTLIDDLPDSDRAAYRETMERLLHLPIRIGHGGHGPSFSRERMREIAANYLKATADL
jgi:glyoxylase-like metal-dependent hydrolase (beta-lactamase superfamily II)